MFNFRLKKTLSPSELVQPGLSQLIESLKLRPRDWKPRGSKPRDWKPRGQRPRDWRPRDWRPSDWRPRGQRPRG